MSLNKWKFSPSPFSPPLQCQCIYWATRAARAAHCPRSAWMGHSDRFKQRASEKDNRQLCIWRVKYACEAKAGEGRRDYSHCVTPQQANMYTLSTPTQQMGGCSEVANIERPCSLSHYHLRWWQLGGRHSYFSAFRGKQKSVWDPSHTHTRAYMHSLNSFPSLKKHPK